ncbi:MAG: HAD family hydrolase [Opitutales bacterium]|nr:HAD family hydrolase [Opitutales bacterium]MCH8540916.1 HAD family hydrolase [Opitutales bacterium]
MSFPYKTVLYDLDGTLIDQFNVIYRCYSFALSALSLPVPSRKTVIETVGGSMEVTMSHFVDAKNHKQAVRLFREHFQKIALDEVSVLPGVIAVLSDLQRRNCPQAVFTNKNGRAARLVCQHLKLTPFLQAIVGTNDTAYRKPQPEFTRHILKMVKTTPETCCLVGDSPFDMNAGKAVGMAVYGVETGTHSREALRVAGATEVYAGLPEWYQALTKDVVRKAEVFR